MKQILILGDSFTYGHGCSDREYYYDFEKKVFVGNQDYYLMPPSEYCWASLLQKDFPELKIINLASPGRSMQGMFYDLYMHFVHYALPRFGQEPEIDCIMFNGTLSDRVEIFLPSDGVREDTICSWGITWEQFLPTSNIFTEPDDRALAKEMYKKNLYHPFIGESATVSSLFGAHSFATSRGIKFMWSLPKESVGPHIKDMIDNALEDTEMPPLFSYDYSRSHNTQLNKHYTCVDNHANNLGHAEYYRREIYPRMVEQYRQGN